MIRATILSLALIGGGLAAQAPDPETTPQDAQQPPPPQGAGPMGLRHGGGHPGLRPGGLHPGGPEGPWAGGMRGDPGHPGMLLKALDLTPEQEKAIRTLMEKRRAEEMPRHKAARDKEEALRTALMDPSTTEAQLRSLHAAASDAQLQAHLAQRALLQDINALLTPDQQAKAKRIREGMRKEQEGRRAIQDEMPGKHAQAPPR